MKANADPTNVHSKAKDHSHTLRRRNRAQVWARAGSAGQGSERARHRSTPDKASIAKASPNTPALCSESQINCGTAVTSPAKAAPAPKATMTAGNTQQISVPLLATKVSSVTPTLRRSGALAE